jgi:transcriptional antiterminator RfaH
MPIEPAMSDHQQVKTGTPDGEHWYAVQSRPHQENRAIGHLEEQGYRPFCPRLRKTVRHARRITQVLAPLFPGYFFVPLDLTRDPWRAINGTRGVARIVTHGELPSPLPHGIVAALKARTNDDGTINWLPSLEIGGTVRIADGPFSELVGTLEHLGPDGRVRVLLSIMGRPVNVSLYQESLIPAA